MSYNHCDIELKWQSQWEKNKTFCSKDFSEKPKFFALIEFPYPSGAGLHVGHIRAFSGLEIVSRKKRMEGYNVLFPIGFDAFGLPTENYAIKTGIHPKEVTKTNIENFTKQLKRVGFSFDWDRVVNTTNSDFYKWTQWIFLQMFKKGLAFRNKTLVNFCKTCQVVLANEESQGGKCDRCDGEVVQKEKDVWFLKITDYAQKLLDGLNDVDYSNRVKTEQRNWIGKSVGANVTFKVGETESLEIFTTRPDTLYGATFMVVAPEHPIIKKLQNDIINLDEVSRYQETAKKKTEFERVQLAKDKTGVQLAGISATNPVSGAEIPIFVADYVMMGYGTGAIMAVPAHDQRDYEFATKYNIPIIEVISGGDIESEAYTDTETGILINSDLLNGMSVDEAKEKIICELVDKNVGCKTVMFKMKDWAFNRQRYWGEPIPVIHCKECGIVPVPEEDLPIVLPDIDNYKPTDNGESPLSSIDFWVNVKCPKCNQQAKRETDTMPQWAGSSWYFLRYADPLNTDELASMDKLKYWMPVDLYNGGMEHVTRHMIYSRFWNSFLYDIEKSPVKEPYLKRTTQGLILGPDGDKMSKSKGNIVNPVEIIEKFGADTLRTYILFIGDYEQETPWNENGVKGARRFLDKIYKFKDKVKSGDNYSKALENSIHKTIKKVTEDIDNTKYNTAIAALMTLVNEYNAQSEISKLDYETLLKLVNPFAPHLAEEVWKNILENEGSINFASWPKYDENKCKDDEITLVLQVNGKLRDKVNVSADIKKEEAEKMALENNKVKSNIEGKTIVKIIFVPKKLVNIVVK